jgi:pyrroline-5-carboxylate reductase
MTRSAKIGIIGGSGQLGGAIARAWLGSGCVAADDLWISNRSGSRAGFAAWNGIAFTTDHQALADECAIVFLSIPPAEMTSLRLMARDRLVVSVMAGIPADTISRNTGAKRIIRAMSSPAADLGLAYSPWCASPGVTAADRAEVSRLFGACGETDEVADADQIDRFTALTGPVPGFVAYFAACMVDHAVKHGTPEHIANRAVRQLFRASGAVLGAAGQEPVAHVDDMIAYAGTTAAGLTAMQASPLADCIERGLDAAYAKVQSFAAPD